MDFILIQIRWPVVSIVGDDSIPNVNDYFVVGIAPLMLRRMVELTLTLNDIAHTFTGPFGSFVNSDAIVEVSAYDEACKVIQSELNLLPLSASLTIGYFCKDEGIWRNYFPNRGQPLPEQNIIEQMETKRKAVEDYHHASLNYLRSLLAELRKEQK